mgnify:CR=1 FL=1
MPNMLRVDEVRKTTLEKHFLRDRVRGRFEPRKKGGVPSESTN